MRTRVHKGSRAGVGGRADIWRVFADGDALGAVVAGIVDPWRDQRVTRVVGIESRGFLLGAAAAVSLGVGFVAVRKENGLLPGVTRTTEAAQDHRGLRHRLRMQAVLTGGDRPGPRPARGMSSATGSRPRRGVQR